MLTLNDYSYCDGNNVLKEAEATTIREWTNRRCRVNEGKIKQVATICTLIDNDYVEDLYGSLFYKIHVDRNDIVIEYCSYQFTSTGGDDANVLDMILASDEVSFGMEKFAELDDPDDNEMVVIRMTVKDVFE